MNIIKNIILLILVLNIDSAKPSQTLYTKTSNISTGTSYLMVIHERFDLFLTG